MLYRPVIYQEASEERIVGYLADILSAVEGVLNITVEYSLSPGVSFSPK